MISRRFVALIVAVCIQPAWGTEPRVTPVAGAVVVELFTSQSCSSCPPADALLSELARAHPEILTLDFHVTYWDRLGWKDPYSLAAATQRQKRYAQLWSRDEVYTPQLVAGGRHQAVGSDPEDVMAAVAAAVADGSPVPVSLERDATGLVVRAGIGQGAGTLWLVGFDPVRVTRIGSGENGGRTLTETNVVRSLVPVGPWSGAALRMHAALPTGERAALLLEAEDGRMLGAVATPLGQGPGSARTIEPVDFGGEH